MEELDLMRGRKQEDGGKHVYSTIRWRNSVSRSDTNLLVIALPVSDSNFLKDHLIVAIKVYVSTGNVIHLRHISTIYIYHNVS